MSPKSLSEKPLSTARHDDSAAPAESVGDVPTSTSSPDSACSLEPRAFRPDKASRTGSVSETDRTMGRAGLIGLTALGGAVIGFALQLAVAYSFGAGTDTDAYFMAQSTSEILGKLLLGGSVTAVFLPLLVDYVAVGKREEAWSLALVLLHLFSALYLVALCLLAVFAYPFVRFVAPGFDAATAELTVSLLRVLLSAFWFLFLVDMIVVVLHALQRFAVPARLRLVAPSVSLVVLLVLAKSVGIYALAIGVVVGAALQLGLVARELARLGFRYRFIWQPRHAVVRRLGHMVYPFIASMLITQGAAIIYRVLVSELASGSLSALKYAEKITQLLTIMFLNSVTIAIYPLLSAKAAQRNYHGLRDTLGAAVRLTTFVTVPFIVGVAMLREPLVTLVYYHGSFTQDSVAMTSQALLWLVVGLSTNAVSSILGHATLALKSTRAAVAVTVVSQAVAILLFVMLVPRMASAGLALASSLVPLSSCLLYFLYLRQWVPRLGSIFWHATYVKIAVLAVVLAGVLALLKFVMVDVAVLSSTLQLVVPTIVGITVFFGGAYVWGVPEMRSVMGIVQAKLFRGRSL